MDHTQVSAIKASSVTLYSWQKEASDKNCKFVSLNKTVDRKTGNNPNGAKQLNTVQKLNLNDHKFLISQNIPTDLKGPKECWTRYNGQQMYFLGNVSNSVMYKECHDTVRIHVLQVFFISSVQRDFGIY